MTTVSSKTTDGWLSDILKMVPFFEPKQAEILQCLSKLSMKP